jgi:hypothetical protein
MEDDSQAVILHGNVMNFYTSLPTVASIIWSWGKKQYTLNWSNVLRTGTWLEHLFVHTFFVLSYEDHA